MHDYRKRQTVGGFGNARNHSEKGKNNTKIK